MSSLFRVANWPFVVRLSLGPVVAIAATVSVAWIGTGGLTESSRAVDSLVRGGEARAVLEQAAKGVQTINGSLYRVLTLQAAQT